ncbi:MAG: MMPL family transporter [Actinomycetota bacterium]|nr:MMPL family transporter [Actinomycetota bacterium]
MHRFFGALSRGVVRYRWLVIACWIVLLVVSARALPSLGSEVNNNNTQFLPASAPSEHAASLLSSIGGQSLNDTELTVVAATNAPLTRQDAAAITREIAAARSVPTVRSVRWLASAANGKAAQLLITSSIKASDVASQKTLVSRVEQTFPHVRAPAGLRFDVAGSVAVNVANQKSSNAAGGKAQGLSFLLIIVVLLIVFRSLLAPILTLLPAGIALTISMRFIAGLGAHGLKISEITQLLLIVLMLGAGTDYGLFLVYRVREEMRRGLDSKAAVAHALERVGESISASAGTVIVALLSLVFASFGVYKDLGVPLAVGVAVMLIAGLTLLPALLAVAGRALFWPTKVRAGGGGDGAWARLTARLLRRPAVTLACGVLFFGALALGLLGYHSAGFGGALSAPAGSSAARGNAVIATDFPQTSSINPANLVFSFPRPVAADPSEVTRAEASLRASGAFVRLAGPFDASAVRLTPARYATLAHALGPPQRLAPSPPSGVAVSAALYNAYRTTLGYISPNGKVVQFQATLTAGSQGSTTALAATPQIRDVVSRAAQASGATDSGVAGEAAALYDISSTSNADLLHIIPIAIVAIAILLALVLRSLVAELYLIVSVALSYLAALGLSTIIFVILGGGGGLTFILPFLMFIFLLALGEDYNILVMTRIREEAHGRTLKDAVIRAVGRTGPTVTSAGVVLAGTFAVLVVAAGGGPGSAQFRDIGAGLALGILMDTFLVRTVLVPATVTLLGRWNWWPSKLADLVPPTGPAHARPERHGELTAVPER